MTFSNKLFRVSRDDNRIYERKKTKKKENKEKEKMKSYPPTKLCRSLFKCTEKKEKGRKIVIKIQMRDKKFVIII